MSDSVRGALRAAVLYGLPVLAYVAAWLALHLANSWAFAAFLLAAVVLSAVASIRLPSVLGWLSALATASVLVAFGLIYAAGSAAAAGLQPLYGWVYVGIYVAVGLPLGGLLLLVALAWAVIRELWRGRPLPGQSEPALPADSGSR